MPHQVEHYEPVSNPQGSMNALPVYVREHTSWIGLERILPAIIRDFGIQPNLAIEFGTWHGYSAAALGNNFKRVIASDIFEGDKIPGTEHLDMIETTRLSLAAWPNVACVKRGYEHFMFNGLPVADLIHVDIVHNYEHTWNCGLLAAAHAGVVIFHDTGNWFVDVPRVVYDIAERFGLRHYHFPHHEGLDILVTTETSRAEALAYLKANSGGLYGFPEMGLLNPPAHVQPPGPMVYGLVSGRHWKDTTGSWDACVRSWDQNSLFRHPRYHVTGKPMMEAYQDVYENTRQEIIAYIHDDVKIFENCWDQRVLKQFEDPNVGVVGFFGGLGHCLPGLYDEPCKGANFVRLGVRSNLVDAEVHGERFDGECDVAVLDGLALFVRRRILDNMGGWPQGKKVSYWGYDYKICMEARRQGFKIRLVGINCQHLASKTPSLITEDWEGAHQELYDEYRDVLPARLP